jgi:PBP1b-binding outer membrane lipoprotein LpoB
MKIKNIFYIAVSTLFLNSCATVETIDPSEVRSSIRDRTKVSKPKKSSKPRKLKVATILPLTGINSKIGKSM